MKEIQPQTQCGFGNRTGVRREGMEGTMKITIDVDCTPEEARTFLGLPDVKPMQDAMMTEVQERLKANLAGMDPETLVKTWLPVGIQGFEQFQKMFWSNLATAARGKEKKE